MKTMIRDGKISNTTERFLEKYKVHADKDKYTPFDKELEDVEVSGWLTIPEINKMFASKPKYTFPWKMKDYGEVKEALDKKEIELIKKLMNVQIQKGLISSEESLLKNRQIVDLHSYPQVKKGDYKQTRYHLEYATGNLSRTRVLLPDTSEETDDNPYVRKKKSIKSEKIFLEKPLFTSSFEGDIRRVCSTVQSLVGQKISSEMMSGNENEYANEMRRPLFQRYQDLNKMSPEEFRELETQNAEDVDLGVEDNGK